MPPLWIPDAGDLIWTDVTPTLGREQSGAARPWSFPGGF